MRGVACAKLVASSPPEHHRRAASDGQQSPGEQIAVAMQVVLDAAGITEVAEHEPALAMFDGNLRPSRGKLAGPFKGLNQSVPQPLQPGPVVQRRRSDATTRPPHARLLGNSYPPHAPK